MSSAADNTARRPRLSHGSTGVESGLAVLRERGPGIASFLLPFTLVLYLGLRGGGYDLIAYSEVGIAVWWIVLLGCSGRGAADGDAAPRRLGRARADRRLHGLDRARDRLVGERRAQRRRARPDGDLCGRVRARARRHRARRAAPHGGRARRGDGADRDPRPALAPAPELVPGQ